MAGVMFAIFALLLRLWRIEAMRATAIVSVLTLLYVPVHAVAFGFERVIAVGWAENAAPGGGAGRVFRDPPRSTCSPAPWCCSVSPARRCSLRWCRASRCWSGYVALGEQPTLAQLARACHRAVRVPADAEGVEGFLGVIPGPAKKAGPGSGPARTEAEFGFDAEPVIGPAEGRAVGIAPE
jgi:hypothetical protein